MAEECCCPAPHTSPDRLFTHDNTIELVALVPSGDSGREIVWRLDTDTTSSHAGYRSERIESFDVGPDWVPRS